MNQNRPIILLTEPEGIADAAVYLLEERGYKVIKEINIENSTYDISGLFIRTYTMVSANYLSQFPNLKYIIRAGVGLDNVDVPECDRRHVSIYNSPGANSDSVSEYVLCVALYMLRQIEPQRQQVMSGNWREIKYMGKGISGQTFGFVGCGNAGRSLSAKISNLGVSCLGYDPYVDTSTMNTIGIKKSTLEQVMELSEVVVMMLPLTAETNNLIDLDKLNMMKKGSIMINVSRGEVVDEVGVAKLVKKGHIKAVLDVVRDEPYVNPALLNIENLYITPHIAGYTEEANTNIAVVAVNNFLNSQKTI